MIQRDKSPTQDQSALAAFRSLISGFLDADACADNCKRISADKLSDPFTELLAHENHMTTVLQSFYGQPVELTVLNQVAEASYYTRMINLSKQGSEHVVEFGIVRIDLSLIPDSAENEILDRNAPLGDILIRHDVLRHVAPQWYLQIAPASPIQSYLNIKSDAHAYGRIATIYCDGRPAIELLEVVSGQ